MNYTPRQLDAFVFLADKRRNHELAEELRLNTLAARGEERALRAAFREMER